MARNIEIKARISHVDALLPKVQAIADKGPFEIIQEDTFFACDTGRLKLRVFSKGHGELMVTVLESSPRSGHSLRAIN
jgi:hypothetical protein